MKKQMDGLEKKEYYSALLIIYGKLLKDNIYERMEAYYLQDYSIGEISESEGVSRNAVFESLESGIHWLDVYEEKLGILKNRNSIIAKLDILDKEEDKDERSKLIEIIKGEINNGI